MTENGERITFKRTRPNPVIQTCLEELLKESKAKKSKLEPMINEALNSLLKYPLPLASGAECAILLGFNQKLCIYLDNYLKTHNSHDVNEIVEANQQTSTHQGSSSVDSNDHESSASHSNDLITLNNESNPVEPKFKYEPAYRSGGYAILIGLLELSNCNNQLVKKDRLIEVAQKYSEESFTRPKPGTFYTAWSNVGTLIKKNLVEKTGRIGAGYTLTEHGKLLATKLFKEIKCTPTINDLIFNDVGFSNDNNEKTDTNINPTVSTNNVEKHAQDVTVETQVIDMEPGTFDVILLIDKNETSGLSKKNDPTVAQFNKFPDLNHEYRSLKVGDFTWIARHKVNKDQELVLPYIVERKRMDDLGASIKDGRFHEQKFRLRKCGLDNVIYMVENYGSNKHVGLPMQSLFQALCNTGVQDGFKVHTTDSLSHSTRFLAMMTKRLTMQFKDKNLKGSNQEPKNGLLMTFEYFNKSSSKNKALSVTDTFIKLLLQLKGVSVEKALAVTNVYKTPSSLIEKYKECEKTEGEKLLANLRYSEICSNVGPSVSKSIYQLFTA